MKATLAPGRIAALACAVACAAGMLSGCAPDAWSNRKTTGYNLYLNTIAAQCKPLLIGQYDMTYHIERQGLDSQDYTYFFDLTSQLYFQRTSPQAYRSGINGFFGGGATTDRSIDCIIAKLPADRPQAGAPLGGAININ
jgi:hypothetical protein